MSKTLRVRSATGKRVIEILFFCSALRTVTNKQALFRRLCVPQNTRADASPVNWFTTSSAVRSKRPGSSTQVTMSHRRHVYCAAAAGGIHE
jgi:hypothetical protein